MDQPGAGVIAGASGDVLFLAHRVPFPPDRGDKIRGYHILRHLAARARVHLVAFADDPRDRSPAAAFTDMLASHTIVPRTKKQWRAGLEALASGRPLSLTAFDDDAVRRAVTDVMARQRVTCAYAFSGQMAPYLPARVRRVMDFVDADSAKFAAYAADARGPMRWMLAREARLLAAFERSVAAAVDASLFVSAEEAALVPGGQPLENGIDAGFFDPAASFAPVAAPGVPLIVFTGQMDYRPNVEAVTAFVRDTMPQLPPAQFAIVGRAPTPSVRALVGERVTVTGEVADVRGWLAAADVVVAPLMLARGIQNKVLEAMAMARPVVASAAAAEGIDHGGALRVAGDAAAMAREIAALLADRDAAAALGRAARARVIARYDWAARLAPLDAIVGLAA
ncbi:TIGR03087 family PEP-CTERM/XrtA system glycosyltransferase [Sphingomonas ginsenosidimutans]|uniref:TIGR03087 family PEP-CTERM/XrtA system glycosyltransferase n=1 Tax=Sphingomonas ginsenosidimutans TaxID=862134 RepID=UPI001FE3E627|nr:TIGR03087 family PEP-CTERM/XrtA system glycosyltransferase [Sphingomonas ginsenosidimutans]